jgi:zinc protease
MLRLRGFAASAGLAWLTAFVTLGLTVLVSAQQRDWPSEHPPRPLAAHDVRFPLYAFRMLPNGLQVIAVPHHEQPAVSLRLIVRAGAAQDPADRPGVAAMVSALLDQGTTAKSAEQIANGIDSIGGALGTGSGPDTTTINAIVMKDSLGVGLDLVSDLAQHPAFAREEIERQRQQTLSGMRVGYDDPEFLANAVFDRLVYGEHPYGRPQSGTPDIVAALTRDDLVAFHKKWFGANNAILAVVGDVTTDEAFAGADRAFGGWGKVPLDAAKPADPPAPARRLVVIDKPGAVQTEIRVGNIAIPRKHPDFMALDLATKILGGEGANRLHRVLRVERGLTYGASADLNALKETGEIVAQTNTRSATTGETLRLIVDEVWKLQRELVGDRELQGAQDYLTGSFPLTIETPSQIATQILNTVFFGLDLNELQTYRNRINAITVDEVQRVARLYFHPDKLTVVLVGDASAFVKQLPASGFDTFDVIPAADLDLTSPDLRRRPPSVSRGGVQPVSYMQPDPARTWLDKAIAAKGGLQKLENVRTVRAEATVTALNAPPFPTITSIHYPDRFRVEADTPSGKVVQVFASGRYWIQDPGGVKELTAAESGAIRAAVERDSVSVLIKAAAGALTLRTSDCGDPTLAGIELSGRDVSPVTFCINRENGLIERSRYLEAAGRSEEIFDDYRDVAGIQVPFHTIVHRAGATPIERDVKTIHYNVPIPPGLFVRPR